MDFATTMNTTQQPVTTIWVIAARAHAIPLFMLIVVLLAINVRIHRRKKTNPKIIREAPTVIRMVVVLEEVVKAIQEVGVAQVVEEEVAVEMEEEEVEPVAVAVAVEEAVVEEEVAVEMVEEEAAVKVMVVVAVAVAVVEPEVVAVVILEVAVAVVPAAVETTMEVEVLVAVVAMVVDPIIMGPRLSRRCFQLRIIL